MGRTLDRSVLVGIGLIVALLVFTTLQTYWNTQRLYEEAISVARTQEVMNLTSDVLLSLIDTESGERGYLYTRRESYLEHYNAGLDQLNKRRAALKGKTQNNPQQKDRVQKLEELITAWLETLRKSIDMRRRNDPRQGLYVQLDNEGKVQMDGIRELVATMEREDNDLLEERRRRSDNAYQVAVMTGLATALMGLIMIGAVIGLLNRSLRTRQNAAAVVQEQREWLRTTLASIGDAVIATDIQGRVTFLNGVAETLTGWKQDEAQGQPLEAVFRIIHEETRRPADNPALRALREGQLVGLANHSLLVARDGTERPVDDSAAPIRDDQGHVAGAVLTFRDITERRRLERELRVRADELTAADRKKDEFLAMLAHELRNPLAPIGNALQILRVARDDGATFAQVQGILDRQLGQMVRLVDDLLDVSRISRGKIDLRTERLEVARVVESALETSRPLLEEAKHELTVRVPPQPLCIVGDSTRLAQVLSNLLNNSAKYTPAGGQIGLTVERQDRHVAIRVRDNGVGIPADMLPGVFELFTQDDRSLHRAQGGLGIGLTLARRLVEMHGGTIEAHSAGEGTGSEFVVRLPLASDDAKPPPDGAREGGAAAARPPARHVLVVDDNQDSAESLGTLLKLLGHEVRTAHDGPSALETAREFRPEVVLLDIGMPGMNGYDVARRMRTMPEVRDALLVAQTGWGQDDDRRQSKEAGFNDHLVKPVDLDDLQRLLASLQPSGNVP
jgi:PAS domain S-box-containing protein